MTINFLIIKMKNLPLLICISLYCRHGIVKMRRMTNLAPTAS